MGAWSAENATKAYLKTMKLGKTAKEPNGAEFISALAAGNNAQLVIAVCAAAVDDTTLALAAAAQQTGGRLICILPNQENLHISTNLLNTYNNNVTRVEFIVGEAAEILANHYSDADFLAIDCKVENYELVLRTVQGSTRKNSTIVLGYNAFCKGSWRKGGQQSTQLLPIGDGLLLTRMAANSRPPVKRSNWVVKVDKCTGEEHVFRVRSPQGRVAKA